MKQRCFEVEGDYSLAGALRATAPGNLRAGRGVIRQRGWVITDEQEDIEAPTASVVLVTKGSKFLGVFHPDEKEDVNMPGGGIESGEQPIEAAGRELWEETGLIATVLPEIYREGHVVAFRAIDPHGKIRGSDEGDVGWFDAEEMAAGRHGDFFVRMMRRISI